MNSQIGSGTVSERAIWAWLKERRVTLMLLLLAIVCAADLVVAIDADAALHRFREKKAAFQDRIDSFQQRLDQLDRLQLEASDSNNHQRTPPQQGPP